MPAWAAIVEMANGDRLHVEINALDDGILEVESKLLGTLRLPWADVVRLQTDGPIRLEFEDGRRVVGEFTVVAGGVEGAANDDIPFLDKTQVTRIFDGPLVHEVEYSGRLNFGGSVFRGNSVENTVRLDSELIARTDSNRYTLAAIVNEGRSFGVRSASDATLTAQYDAFYNLKDYLFVKGVAEQDGLADLRLRTSLGAGYGRQFIESKKRNLALEAGLSAIQENYTLSSDQAYPSLGLVMKYDQRVFNSAVKFFNVSNVNINLSQTNDHLLRNRMGFRVPIAKNLNFSTQLLVDYDNTPVLGQKKTDSSLSFSVGYGF